MAAAKEGQAKTTIVQGWPLMASGCSGRSGETLMETVHLPRPARIIYCHQFWEAARPWMGAGKVQLPGMCSQA